MNGGEKANNMTSKVLYNFHNCHDYLYSNYVETIKISMFFRETATSLTLLPELREWTLTRLQVCDDLHFTDIGSQIYKIMRNMSSLRHICRQTRPPSAAGVGSIDKRTKRRIGCNRRVWSCEDGEEKMVAWEEGSSSFPQSPWQSRLDVEKKRWVREKKVCHHIHNPYGHR